MDSVTHLCSLCQDRGIIITAHDTARTCECVQRKAYSAKFKNARLAPQIEECKFANFNPDYYPRDYFDVHRKISYYDQAVLALGAAQNFTQDFLHYPHGDGLIFTGPVGSGKTFLAGCIANAVLEGGGEVLFLVVPDLLDEIKATYEDGKQTQFTERDLIDAARQAPLLILDDLGAHNYTEWTRNKLYTIINYRMNFKLPTVITTNFNLDELDEYLGERTTSRLSYMCRAYRLPVETDIRIIKRQEKDIVR